MKTHFKLFRALAFIVAITGCAEIAPNTAAVGATVPTRAHVYETLKEDIKRSRLRDAKESL